MPYIETETTRECEAVAIPNGNTVMIPPGTRAVITQSLGDTFTVQLPTVGGLYRIAGKDADAIGQARPTPAADEVAVADGPVDEALVWDQLRQVYDPEIPVNIVELGLVYDLRIEPAAAGGSVVHVQMTLTAPGCGMGPVIASDAQRRIEGLPGVREAFVEVVFDPPWSQQMMTEAARLELGLL